MSKVRPSDAVMVSSKRIGARGALVGVERFLAFFHPQFHVVVVGGLDPVQVAEENQRGAHYVGIDLDGLLQRRRWRRRWKLVEGPGIGMFVNLGCSRPFVPLQTRRRD